MPRFSPDSRLIAYDSSETNRTEVYIQTFPPGGGKWQVSTNGGREPKWRADGREIYFANGAKMMAASVSRREPAVEIGVPQELFESRIIANAGDHYAARPDGKLFFFAVFGENAQDRPVTVLLNWRLTAGESSRETTR
jgi:hypothetical protein